MQVVKPFTALACTLTLVAACGGAPAPSDHRILDKAILSSANGMSTNGMSTNGMSTNGLSTNGLSTGGLSTPAFATWFLLDPSFASTVMAYVARCAMPAGKTLSYTVGGFTYGWVGVLGLAPTWSAGLPMPVAEQQLVSACLAAHANKYGVHVNISVRGYGADRTPIPVSAAEATSYPNDEGCFFGNLFDHTGVLSAYSYNSPMVNRGITSLRVCAVNDGHLGECAPMTTTGYSCQDLCTGGSPGTLAYQTCTWGGVAYRPISVRLADAQIATCGDGICAPSESCSSCAVDCGACR